MSTWAFVGKLPCKKHNNMHSLGIISKTLYISIYQIRSTQKCFKHTHLAGQVLHQRYHGVFEESGSSQGSFGDLCDAQLALWPHGFQHRVWAVKHRRLRTDISHGCCVTSGRYANETEGMYFMVILTCCKVTSWSPETRCPCSCQ